jgi:hypothetical protein
MLNLVQPVSVACSPTAVAVAVKSLASAPAAMSIE